MANTRSKSVQKKKEEVPNKKKAPLTKLVKAKSTKVVKVPKAVKNKPKKKAATKRVSTASGKKTKRASTNFEVEVHGGNGSFSEDHVLDDDQYKAMVELVDINLDDNVSLVASDTSQEASHALVGKQSVILSPKLNTCERCLEILRSRHGLIKHMIGHHINDLNSKRPSMSSLYPHVEKMILEALQEIGLEYGEEKSKFVVGVLKSSEADVKDDWKYFISTVSKPFLNNVCKASKVMPANQYEEQLKKLNKLLNKEENYHVLLDSLKKLNEDVTLPQHVPGMVLFRLCTKLVDSLAVFVFKTMRDAKEDSMPSECLPMSENESKAFVIHMRKLIQVYYRKGLRQGSNLWITRCACIRQGFIDYIDSSEPPSVDAVLSNESWEEDSAGVLKLQLNNRVIKVFISLEKVVENLLKTGSGTVNIDSVMNEVFSNSNEDMLDIWYMLTAKYFSENEALVFLRDLASLIMTLSLRLEIGRKREALAKERIQKYALRTDLKRN